MSRRPANFTQADVERMIRAAKAQGVPHVRITATAGQLSMETLDKPDPVNSAKASFNDWLGRRKDNAGAR